MNHGQLDQPELTVDQKWETLYEKGHEYHKQEYSTTNTKKGEHPTLDRFGMYTINTKEKQGSIKGKEDKQKY